MVELATMAHGLVRHDGLLVAARSNPHSLTIASKHGVPAEHQAQETFQPFCLAHGESPGKSACALKNYFSNTFNPGWMSASLM